jgi:hypothetical protein
MGIVDFFQHRRVITEAEAERLRGAGNSNKLTDSKPKGITVADVLAVFPGSNIVKPEPAKKIPPSQLRMLQSKVSHCRVCQQPIPLNLDGTLNLWLHECLKKSGIRIAHKEDSRISEADWEKVPEADQRAIRAEADQWVQVQGEWQRLDKPQLGPLRCPHCGDDPHAKAVIRTWPNSKSDWMCHKCGKVVVGR